MDRAFKLLSGLIVVLFTLMSFSLSASASSSQWKDPAYNFQSIKKILIKKPTIHYEYREFTVSGNHSFTKYRNVEDISLKIVQDKLIKNFSKKYPSMFNTSLWDPPPVKPLQTSQTIFPETPQDIVPVVDAVLSVKIIDMGVFFKYYPAYDTWETVTDEEIVTYTDSNGKEKEIKRTIKRQVPVTRAARHDPYDSAGAELILQDAKTGAVIWTCSDVRIRYSPYDKTGPESVLQRIINDASKKLDKLLKDK